MKIALLLWFIFSHFQGLEGQLATIIKTAYFHWIHSTLKSPGGKGSLLPCSSLAGREKADPEISTWWMPCGGTTELTIPRGTEAPKDLMFLTLTSAVRFSPRFPKCTRETPACPTYRTHMKIRAVNWVHRSHVAHVAHVDICNVLKRSRKKAVGVPQGCFLSPGPSVSTVLSQPAKRPYSEGHSVTMPINGWTQKTKSEQ